MNLICYVMSCDCTAVTIFWGFALCDPHYDRFAAKMSIVTSFWDVSRAIMALSFEPVDAAPHL